MDQVIASANDTLAQPIIDVVLTEAPALESPTLMFVEPDVSAQDNQPMPIIAFEYTATPRDYASRALDLVLATTLVILTLPLMLFSALAILVSSPGPIFFSQKRIGRYGKEFNCLKFRTMIPNAELAIPSMLQASAAAGAEWGAIQKLHDDPRITGVGKFLRRYCLDELPQLFNVLAGQMSMVGPRPIVSAEVGRYGPFFQDYCSVRPGLTGLWQVSGRHALSYEERVGLDAAYAKTKSINTDLRIVWRTVPIVLTGKNM